MTDRSGTEQTEGLWSGTFGDDYVDRNRVLDDRRAAFWSSLIERHGITSVLEVGCGQGANLVPIAAVLPPERIWGVDINARALERARQNAPGVNLVTSLARELPFRDRFVDLAFTVGVLIHQAEDGLPLAVAEIVRCSARFVLWGEYYADKTESIPYRGQTDALFRRDYGAVYASVAPTLVVRDSGYLAPEDGFDRITWQLLERD